jgi:DNA-binding NtrC family response regulator
VFRFRLRWRCHLLQSHERAQIAVVEDDPIMGESLLQRLTLEGYDARWWQTGAEAVEGLRQRRADLVVCDIRLPDMNGEEVFHQALPDLVGSPVLFITGYGSIDQAVRLIRAGADDYLTKPFQMEEFLERIDHLLHQRGQGELVTTPVLGESVPMRRVEAMLRRIADIDSTLLLTGESGVGKEVAARFAHDISAKAKAPFIAVNCAAIPANLIESELFGHERGAFTGAHSRHEGYAERARDGVLFLDEISELSPQLQAKLLRLVQDRAFFRVGGERPVPFRARLICATNADLTVCVREGRFREDLYFRVNVIEVYVPPLRDRPADIAPLLRHYTAYFAAALKADVRGVTSHAESMAMTHGWPGNVRELRNRVERAVALASGPWLDPADLFPDLVPRDLPPEMLPSLANVVDAAQRRHIQTVLERSGGQLKKAAELLGISRTTLWEKMRKLGLSTESPDDVRNS